MMPWQVRPLGPWTGPVTKTRRDSPFKSTWTATLNLLDREVAMLGARSFVLQIDVSDRWIRRDGALYERAQPDSPAVRVVFDSRHGTLNYGCDKFWRWQDNARAVALALEALRKVDRYGVADSGEQYRGWTELPQRPHEMSREQAAEFIAHWSGLGSNLALLSNQAALMAAYRAAAKHVHPDAPGGDHDTMARLNAARDTILNGASR